MSRLLAAAIGLLVAALFVSGAAAEITAVGNDVEKVTPPPNSVLVGAFANDGKIRAFDERQDHRLLTTIAVDICNPAVGTCDPLATGTGTYDSTLSLVGKGGTIAAGTCVDSHFLHFDPSSNQTRTRSGFARFATDILGVILLPAKLNASDASPGLEPSTIYEKDPARRGVQLDPPDDDSVVISADRRQITVTFTVAGNAGAVDQARVITAGSCGPGDPETLTLSPKADSNEVATKHCVTATVKDEFGAFVPGVKVVFDVEGASELDTHPADEDGTVTTNQDGQAEHCYTGPETPGADAIKAFADDNEDGIQNDPPPTGNEPFDTATKTWEVTDAHSLLLEPKEDTNPVFTEHCVTATVRDAFLNPTPKVTVRFTVTRTLVVVKSGSDITDENGVAQFCYIGPKQPAVDAIRAYADEDKDQTEDATEPFDLAAKTWGPGQPASLLLEPKLASNKVQEKHCVTATVEDAFFNRTPNIVVRFLVTGASEGGQNPASKDGSATTDENGQAEYCYFGSTLAGPDAIHAFADTDKDSTQDAGEPFDDAVKTWLPLDPAKLRLEPDFAENVVTDQESEAHCVQAYVTDLFDNPNPNIVVRFTVTGTVTKSGSDTTDLGGVAEFCYTSTTAGLDKIHAYADTDNDNMQDATEPFDVATKLWHPGKPAKLTLDPRTDSNPVGDEHCVRAEVQDIFTNPTPDIVVRFNVEGASEQDTDPADEDGSATTDDDGHATFCYTGPDLPGEDAIHAYADSDEDNIQDADEPFDDVAKTWTFPISTPGCEIVLHDGGWILTVTGSKGSFGGNARIELDGSITRGQLTYQDHSALLPITFHSSDVVAIVCVEDAQGPRADVYGTGEVNGVGPVNYRIRVRDRGEPGSQPLGPDTYQIITAAYTSGVEDNPLRGGNIQIHRFP